MCKNDTSLSDMVDEFRAKAYESFKALFSPDQLETGSWASNKSLRSSFDYILIIKSDNEEYSSIMCVGLDLHKIDQFFRDSVDSDRSLDLLKDALTEFGNVYCGLINDIPLFSKKYGILRQHPPQEAVKYAFFSTMDSAVEGYLLLPEYGEELYVGYGIHTKNKAEQKQVSKEFSTLFEGL
ncbi:hypothetical protein [Chitinivibrio alkaliphilus]|uniref:Chemotaxis phosphatase CheX-like domain-containing protein n=1 Tax=Chitinivibrio alkaliphilus ACht1 TaxID=1313304 RepID=U7D6F4_9BACT|nr:hypothetical protein [Chitinivibrio alkaliphilus]ERP32099.1 hypothetical protein CALK_0819 [Chitinivibrio alkaliphilus ACht1]